MQKINLTILFLVCISVGCSFNNRYNYVIQNNSTVNVSFIIKGYGDDIYSLAIGASITINLYSDANLLFTNNERVDYKIDNENFLISINDKKYYYLYIYNNSGHNIILSDKYNNIGYYGQVFNINQNENIIIKAYEEILNLEAYYTDMPYKYPASVLKRENFITIL